MTQSFSNFITEEEKEQSYRFVIIYNDPENMTDDSKAEAEEIKKQLEISMRPLEHNKKLRGIHRFRILFIRFD